MGDSKFYFTEYKTLQTKTNIKTEIMNSIILTRPFIPTIKGKDVLTVKTGELVKVISHTQGFNVGDIIMRTSNDERPFVGLKDGTLWNNSLENYSFILIKEEVIIKPS